MPQLFAQPSVVGMAAAHQKEHACATVGLLGGTAHRLGSHPEASSVASSVAVDMAAALNLADAHAMPGSLAMHARTLLPIKLR